MQTVLESGSLPVSFEYAQSQTVGPTLGQDALASGVLVALIGLAVVMLYLLFFYRGLGLITAAAMIVFAVLYLASWPRCRRSACSASRLRASRASC